MRTLVQRHQFVLYLNMPIKLTKTTKGFTLIELLVTIGIIAILSAISLFAVNDARKSARDGRRKADLESLRGALELYRADCTQYPINSSVPSLSSGNVALVSGAAPCSASGIRYLEVIPKDPSASTTYRYNRLSNVRYAVCARLEEPPVPVMTVTDCGGNCPGNLACNYILYNP